MYKNIFSLISGLFFGIGLTISGMTNPAKVIGFLNVTDNWDPSLIFVMIGAIALCSPAFYLLKKRVKPLFSQEFEKPTIKDLDRHLIIGSSLFGLGWGMVGFCPGPAISSLALSQNISIIFVLAMALGFYISRYIKLTA